MRRKEILCLISRLRQLRDRAAKRDGTFERGRSAAYGLAAHMLYREAKDSGVLFR